MRSTRSSAGVRWVLWAACALVSVISVADRGSWIPAWEARLVEADRLDAEGFDADATRVLEEALATARDRAPGSLPEARSLDALAEHHLRHGRARDAAALYVESVARLEALLGAEQPRLGTSLYNLGVACFLLDRHDEADAALTRAVAIWERTLGPDHPGIAEAMRVRADIAARMAPGGVSAASVSSGSGAGTAEDHRRP